MKTLCGLWNLAPADAVAFGDNYNDVEMLELVGHSWLMGNAPELLKKRLPNNTADHNNDGIAEVLVAYGVLNWGCSDVKIPAMNRS